MNFWMDKGIGGFRMDVIELIGKDPDKLVTVNGPMFHPYLRKMNRETFGGKNLLTAGECWNADYRMAQTYSNPDGSELSMVFVFQHLELDQVQGATNG